MASPNLSLDYVNNVDLNERATMTLFNPLNTTSYSPDLMSDLSNEINPSVPSPDDLPALSATPLSSIIGVLIAVFANSLNGLSIILKKQSLKNLQETGHLRASEGGFGYLKEGRWWLGISMLGFGELLNFVALMFAPAILVTPLGVMALVTTTALSPILLKEKTGPVGLLGCLLVLVGCVIITLCGPKDLEVASMEEFEYHLISPGFLIYAGSIIAITSFLIYISPKYGSKYLLLYVFIVGSYGSLSVMFCKGIGVAIKASLLGVNAFARWSVWVCIFCLIACLMIETAYNQVSLDLFNTAIVMSVTYVIFSTLIIAGSAIIFSAKQNIGTKDIILTVLGFIVNVIALYMMNLDKNPEMILKNTDEDQCQTPEKIVVHNVEQSTDQYDARLGGEKEDFNASSIEAPATVPVTVDSKPQCGLKINSSMFREAKAKNSYLSLVSDETPCDSKEEGTTRRNKNHSGSEDKIKLVQSCASFNNSDGSSVQSLCQQRNRGTEHDPNHVSSSTGSEKEIVKTEELHSSVEEGESFRERVGSDVNSIQKEEMINH